MPDGLDKQHYGWAVQLLILAVVFLSAAVLCFIASRRAASLNWPNEMTPRAIAFRARRFLKTQNIKAEVVDHPQFNLRIAGDQFFPHLADMLVCCRDTSFPITRTLYQDVSARMDRQNPKTFSAVLIVGHLSHQDLYHARELEVPVIDTRGLGKLAMALNRIKRGEPDAFANVSPQLVESLRRPIVGCS